VAMAPFWKLTDLSTADHHQHVERRANGMCGSLLYLAPELAPHTIVRADIDEDWNAEGRADSRMKWGYLAPQETGRNRRLRISRPVP
jgi:hypothetical protein